MSAEATAVAPARWHRLRWGFVVAILAGWFLAPPLDVLNATLDSSNYGSYSWLAAHRWQFGTDTIAMTGPYGYLAYGTTYTGDLFFARWVGDVLLKIAFAFLLVELALRTAPRRRGWILAILLFLPNVGDLFPDCLVLVAALRLLSSPRRWHGDGGALLSAAILGFMILMKGTNAFVALAALVTVAAQAALERQRRRAVILPLVAGAACVIAWVAAGQRLSALPSYLRGVWELANGYNATMGLPSDTREFATGLALLLGLLALFLSAAWRLRRELPRVLGPLFLAGFSFLKWKHGFVRADGHVYIFFNYAVLALAFFWLTWRHDEPRSRGLVTLSAALLGVGLVASGEFRFGRLVTMVTDQPARLAANAEWFFARAHVRARLEAELAEQRARDDLPFVREEIRDRSVDFFGFEQGVLLLNRFTYQPRPMGGGTFNVFTRYLQERNDRFIRNPSRQPAFQLVKIQTLDGRLPTADDPLTLTALLHLYTPVRAERDYVLFARSAAADAPRPTVRETRTVRLGETIALPPSHDDELLCFSLEIDLTPTGRLQSFLLRPPLLHVAVTTDRTQRFRLAPAMATVPVLLSPLVETSGELLALYGGAGARRPTHLTLAGDDGYAATARITFYTLPAPPAAPERLAVELQDYLAHPLTNRTPLEVVSGDNAVVTELQGQPILYLHAPGRLVLPLRSDDRLLQFEYGLLPQTYDPGQTKGVEFRVELPLADQPPRVLFSRTLEPVTEPLDRGVQAAQIYLPPDLTANRLVLRTLPGPSGDASWAQAFVRHVQLSDGPVDPRQFRGFNVTPLPPGFASHPEHPAEGRPVRAFHPPAELVFPVPVDASTVTVATGLQAAAYRGENRTDGVEFALSLLTPGKPVEPLASWRMDPLTLARDRGTRTVVVPLPPTRSEGTTLRIQVRAGPADDDRWDWAYLETVYFR